MEGCTHTPTLSAINTDKAGNRDVPVLADVRHEWEFVKPGIEQILAASSPLTYRVEDVYAACVHNEAHLWTSRDGFVVTTTELDTYTGEKTFLFWIAWASQRGSALSVAHRKFFEDVARETGHTKVEVRTAVPEVAEFLKNSNWQLSENVFVRDLY